MVNRWRCAASNTVNYLQLKRLKSSVQLLESRKNHFSLCMHCQKKSDSHKIDLRRRQGEGTK